MKGRKPTEKHLHLFGSKCYILKDNYEHIGKFDSKELEAIFLGYSLERTTYRVYVIDNQKVLESMDVTLYNNNYLGTGDNEEKDPLFFENIEEKSASQEKSHLNEESTNTEGNSKNKDNQEKGNELLLENSHFVSCNNLGGVSQETTSEPINNLKDTTSISQETS